MNCAASFFGVGLISPGGTPWRHVHGIAPQDPEEGRELLHFGERVLGPDLRERRLEVDVEHVLEVLRRADVGVVDEPDGPVPVGPRLDLGQTDVPERERREHLEQHARPLVVREHDARLERPVRPRDDGLTRQHHKPGHVARVVLDPVRQDLEPVQLRRARARNRRRVAEVVRRDVLRGPGGVVHGLARRLRGQLRQGVLALGERLRVRDHAREVLHARAGEREEAMVDRELDLADDVEAVAEEEVVVPVDRAAEGVLHRQDGAVRDPELHGLEGDLELVARDRLALRIGFPGGCFGVGSGDALVGHAELRTVHRSRGQVGDGERLGRLGGGRWELVVDVDGDEGEVDGGLVPVDGGDAVGSAAVGVVGGGGGLAVLADDLAGEDGAGALPVGLAGADAVGVVDRVGPVGAPGRVVGGGGDPGEQRRAWGRADDGPEAGWSLRG
ncbi:hypothetical protein EUGRSUZ_B03894 [Eucalyptus grandis]|uniref:Uncharacterized protein n=2 Tax=Eucalyptus grandis TaxID=71139 RepID=A0ACC3LYK9_EUCGR|nr:hypothetical protein EUGRSUZ_B03894 [Eucalyptus grandis]